MGDLIGHIRDRDLEGLRAGVAASPGAARHPRAVVEAGQAGWQAALEVLVEAGADLNAVWRNYRPLHALMQEGSAHGGVVEPARGRVECLAWMLGHGADPEQTGGWPQARGLIVAAFVGVPEYVEALLAGGAREDGYSAAALGDLEAVKEAIGAVEGFAQARDRGGLTALQCVAGSRLAGANALAIAGALLDAGADARAQTKSWSQSVDAVYFAAGRGNLALFELLLERGADATAALSAALWAGAYELADAALARGAVADRAEANGKPLLNDLIRWGQFGAAQWLLERKASPNVADERGWTAVHQAASRGNERMLQAVLAAGGDGQRRDKEGNTPRDVTRGEKLAALLGRER